MTINCIGGYLITIYNCIYVYIISPLSIGHKGEKNHFTNTNNLTGFTELCSSVLVITIAIIWLFGRFRIWNTSV